MKKQACLSKNVNRSNRRIVAWYRRTLGCWEGKKKRFINRKEEFIRYDGVFSCEIINIWHPSTRLYTSSPTLLHAAGSFTIHYDTLALQSAHVYSFIYWKNNSRDFPNNWSDNNSTLYLGNDTIIIRLFLLVSYEYYCTMIQQVIIVSTSSSSGYLLQHQQSTTQRSEICVLKNWLHTWVIVQSYC